MSFKEFIALFLVVVFLGKLVTLDSRFSELILESSGITMVKKTCVNQQDQENGSTILSTETGTQDLAFDYLCHSVFNLQLEDWPLRFSEDNFKAFSYTAPGFIPPHGDKFYPPPRV